MVLAAEASAKTRRMKVLISILLLLSLATHINSDLSSDTAALLEFADAVPHVRNLNWNAANPICTSWIGITCSNDNTRVAGVHLPGIGLFGEIPANTYRKLDALKVLSLRSNHLSGDLPSDILSLPSLQALYLQRNNFSGAIPLFLSPRLAVVDLSSNSLSGAIPPSLAELKRLAVLNLEFNSFTGNLPNLDIPTLKMLNVSYNSLNGSIPQSLAKFPASSFIGNADLSSAPSASSFAAPPQQGSSSSSPQSAKSRKLNTGSIVAISVACACLAIVALAYLLMICVKKRNQKHGSSTRVIKVKTSSSDGVKTENLKSDDFGSGVQGAEKIKLTVFQGCSFNFDLEDLLRASAEVLGKGTHGTTYKAILDESTTVAVKRLKDVAVAKKEFDQYMEVVGRLGRHPNVVPLLAYYCSKDEKLLVYEYMPSGSLSAALHGNRDVGGAALDWDSRLNVAIGAARGVAHIHSEGGAKFIHGNIKSSNILLRGGLDGCISDLGLSPLLTGYNDVKYRVAGYRAPEVMETARKATQKSDVYSFGVVLLEMLTGKSPVRCPGYEEVVDLPRWVRSVVREEWTAEVFDVELIKHGGVEEELVQMLQIAFCCVAKVAEARPSMDEVVGMMERVRHPDVENRPSSEDNRSKDSNVQTP
ncbi:LOW QUALITY PROTEIN: probable inactive receptor kinase At5g58300 [Salvia miltiorrhiza]|uniref:LOW QUALITY PROTEIN: probable inactive receptor kinase At5g58300 n=1 Tax=Salvia miltiorrhiza TaxID=226208 RepID=UPI0025AD5411|nr:LOW QUALITY PROTEIN: probable inactive receptor kinase At5g58300 [Salvia miltiorrhiza]